MQLLAQLRRRLALLLRRLCARLGKALLRRLVRLLLLLRGLARRFLVVVLVLGVGFLRVIHHLHVGVVRLAAVNERLLLLDDGARLVHRRAAVLGVRHVAVRLLLRRLLLAQKAVAAVVRGDDLRRPLVPLRLGCRLVKLPQERRVLCVLAERINHRAYVAALAADHVFGHLNALVLAAHIARCARQREQGVGDANLLRPANHVARHAHHVHGRNAQHGSNQVACADASTLVHLSEQRRNGLVNDLLRQSFLHFVRKGLVNLARRKALDARPRVALDCGKPLCRAHRVSGKQVGRRRRVQASRARHPAVNALEGAHVRQMAARRVNRRQIAGRSALVSLRKARVHPFAIAHHVIAQQEADVAASRQHRSRAGHGSLNRVARHAGYAVVPLVLALRAVGRHLIVHRGIAFSALRAHAEQRSVRARVNADGEDVVHLIHQGGDHLSVFLRQVAAVNERLKILFVLRARQQSVVLLVLHGHLRGVARHVRLRQVHVEAVRSSAVAILHAARDAVGRNHRAAHAAAVALSLRVLLRHGLALAAHPRGRALAQRVHVHAAHTAVVVRKG